jgi:hypothetical protein
LCAACASTYSLVSLDNAKTGCILTTDLIAGCLNYTVGEGVFCTDGYCDTANGYAQVSNLDTVAGITCIPAGQTKSDCAAYTYDATNNLYLCASCITGSNTLLPIALTPVTINLCMPSPAITNCALYANNTATTICLACSSGNFLGKDENNKSICIPDADQRDYCTNYNSSSYVCLVCIAGITPADYTIGTGDGATTITLGCNLNPSNVIPNCKTVNITGNDIKCI